MHILNTSAFYIYSFNLYQIKMEDKNTLIEEKLRKSFSLIKEEIENIRKDIEWSKNVLYKQKDIISALNNKIKELSNENKLLKQDLEENKTVSTGNDGVIHSFIHSFNSHSDKQTMNNLSKTMNETMNKTISKTINEQTMNIQTFKESLDNTFKNLPRQEFLTFLTVYQLEDDLKRPINYFDISSHLKLSEGCIRTYISNLLKKKLPLTKTKVNNKLVQLQINSYFRELNLKQKLISLYELSNLDQKTLSDAYAF